MRVCRNMYAYTIHFLTNMARLSNHVVDGTVSGYDHVLDHPSTFSRLVVRGGDFAASFVRYSCA